MAAVVPPITPAQNEQLSRQLAVDRQAVLQHTTFKGIQLFAVITPPILILTSVYRRTFSVSRFLRNTAASTFILGTALGAGSGMGRMYGMDAAKVNDRALRIRYNVGQRRVDDWCVIGSVLGALVTTTLFMKRASILWTLPGGASLGIAGGVIAHVMKNRQDGTTQGVGMMLDEAKEAVVDKGEDK